ncbi:hypothetical protein [Oerskovia turbata]
MTTNEQSGVCPHQRSPGGHLLAIPMGDFLSRGHHSSQLILKGLVVILEHPRQRIPPFSIKGTNEREQLFWRNSETRTQMMHNSPMQARVSNLCGIQVSQIISNGLNISYRSHGQVARQGADDYVRLIYVEPAQAIPQLN